MPALRMEQRQAEPDVPEARVLILGLGNTLLTDDGVGVRAAELFAAQAGPHTACVDGGTLGFRLADLIFRHPACVIVDAADMGASPGTVKCLDAEAVMRPAAGGSVTVHDLGLPSLLRLLWLERVPPPRLAIIGVQPLSRAFGTQLSPAIETALPELCAEIETIIQSWGDAA
jgi:hydrogenase maturation protease